MKEHLLKKRDSLLEKNLAFFKREHPAISEKIENSPFLASKVVSKGKKTNLVIGDISYYYDSFEETFKNQLENIKEFSFGLDAHTSLLANGATPSEIAGMSVNALNQIVDQYQLEKKNDPIKSFDMLIIAGLGTAQHVLKLAKRFKAHHIIILEESIHVLKGTLEYINWETLIKNLKKLGCTLRFECATTVNTMESCSFFLNGLSEKERLLLTRSFFFLHSNSTFFLTFKDLFAKSLPSAFTVNGFIEDECTMTKNIVMNLKTSCQFAANIQRKEKNCPLLVVASGPSLEKNFDLIADRAASMIVISCGTAISGLLKHKIKPDIHCEIENGSQISSQFRELAKNYTFDGIQLFASYSCDARLQSYFKDPILFHRPGPHIGHLISETYEPLNNCEPSVINLALAIGAFYGFGSAYILGGDLGSIDPEQHHAESVEFYKNEILLEEFRKEMQLSKSFRSFNLTQSANFGGTCYTNSMLTFFSFHLSHALKIATELSVYNCSDGILVENTIPCLPTSIPKLPHTTKDKARDLEAIRDSTVAISEVSHLFQKKAPSLEKAYDRLANLLRASVAKTCQAPDVESFLFALPSILIHCEEYTDKENSDDMEQQYTAAAIRFITPSLRDILSQLSVFLRHFDLRKNENAFKEIKQLLQESLNQLIEIMNSNAALLRKLA